MISLWTLGGRIIMITMRTREVNRGGTCFSAGSTGQRTAARDGWW